ncbi:isoleucine--tRNA ligase [Moheibacter sediminis]|uniref:Isoleucine--tRNA ligase n=1 Tax=Moheibacter sediminis TaxID=1434700 RepID=A0A1W2C2T0_9FLAO|nr:isoleucine--tRNA ligase [Moheibacter sediminis]SMC79535.1 Isoleucyl-tRNA synthetase [Moheibacter sediminis]
MSKNFKEYKQLDLVKLAEEVLTDWNRNQVFEKSVSSREGQQNYVFYEGPPSANGLPGIHHVMARAIKDIFCRYHTLKGEQVHRKAGWDTHGLPIELGVEKELGITKEDIGKKISVEDYNKACREAVMRYTDIWNDLTQKMGYWVDLKDPYITYEPKYMESVWWLLKQIYNKDLLYKGYTIQPYSPKAGTGLSSHELNQPGTYRDVTDTTVVAQFKADKNSSDFLKGIEGDVYFLAWTTTPWTLPSNTALTVGSKIEYVLVETFNQYTFRPQKVILGKPLLNSVFGKNYFESNEPSDFENFKEGDKKFPYQIIETFKGSDLVGIKYEQLLPWVLPFEDADKAFRVIDGDFVTTEDGTGIVHTAPTFGADDAKVAKEHGVPPMLVLDENRNPVPLVDLQGKFVAQLPEGFGGKYVKNEYYDEGTAPERSVDVEISIKLKEENKAFKVEKYKHNYPHCWRTDKPILYYPLDSWFIKVTSVRERMAELNKSINWKPKATGEGRFGNWLENANDWNLSRSRYWGIPLPIWRTEDKSEEIIIGSVEELMKEIQKSINSGLMKQNPFEGFEIGNMSEENYAKIDLHKNIVDEIIFTSNSGKPMKRESDLIDVWFDSGAMPYAQFHYPFENKDWIDSGSKYPADFIAEGVDQTRGWFYTLHAIGTLVFDSVAYKNVVSNGLVLDKNGQKMSKRLGNAVDPFETLSVYGPDATRWYMIANAQPWENLKFDIAGVDEVRRKFFGTLYNTYSFFALYANVDGFKYEEAEIPVEERSELDRWILSELNSLIKKVDEFYADYEPTRAARAIQEFVIDNLSNWHVRLSRRRFWKGDYSKDKISAYQTLYTVLENVAILSAPIAPFFSDRLYKDLNEATGKNEVESVHLAYFPKADETLIDSELEVRTQLAQAATSMILSLRKGSDMRVRQPLQKVIIPVLDETMKQRLESVSELLKQEVNVKEIQLLTNEEASHLLVKSIKPNFKTLGPKHGQDMKAISAATVKLINDDIVKLESEGKILLNLDNKTVELELEDFEISAKDIPGWTVTSNGNLTVALDIQLTDELRSEGVARELVNRIQNLRKENGLEVTDKIRLILKNDDKIETSVIQNKDYICSETLAAELLLQSEIEGGTKIEIDDLITEISISKI